MKSSTQKYLENWILSSPPESAAALRDVLASDAKKDEKIRKLEQRVTELSAEPKLRAAEAKQFAENYRLMQDRMNNEIDMMRDRIFGALAQATARCPEQESGGCYCTLPKGHKGGHYVKEMGY